MIVNIILSLNFNSENLRWTDALPKNSTFFSRLKVTCERTMLGIYKAYNGLLIEMRPSSDVKIFNIGTEWTGTTFDLLNSFFVTIKSVAYFNIIMMSLFCLIKSKFLD